ncbi:MAG: ribonuclease HII [Novosphingobium sp.]|nr:ribonuclease HII [Novosphingobium sp.]
MRLDHAVEATAAPAPCRERLVVGVDEAGRGPLAGPVVAAAVVLCKPRPVGLDDSKKLAREVRAVLDERIRRRCAFGVGVVEVEEIERLNIFGATMLAMTLAVAALCRRLDREPDEILVDGNLTPKGRREEWRWAARPIVGGDGSEPCISAASVVAKEHRDRIMREHARAHPQYGWETNVGYGTPFHLAALREHGPTPLHRRLFAPVAQLELFGGEISRAESFAPHHEMLSPAPVADLNIV